MKRITSFVIVLLLSIVAVFAKPKLKQFITDDNGKQTYVVYTIDDTVNKKHIDVQYWGDCFEWILTNANENYVPETVLFDPVDDIKLLIEKYGYVVYTKCLDDGCVWWEQLIYMDDGEYKCTAWYVDYSLLGGDKNE